MTTTGDERDMASIAWAAAIVSAVVLVAVSSFIAMVEDLPSGILKGLAPLPTQPGEDTWTFESPLWGGHAWDPRKAASGNTSGNSHVRSLPDRGDIESLPDSGCRHGRYSSRDFSGRTVILCAAGSFSIFLLPIFGELQTASFVHAQITLPMILGGAITLAGTILTVYAGNTNAKPNPEPLTEL